MKTKLIFNTFLAKKLLKDYGHPIIDLLKDHKRQNGVICVFEDTEQFEKDLEKATASIE